MAHFEYGTPENFLGLEGEAAEYALARAVVLPLPYEATVSFGQGTRHGPRALINASRQVELYDREFDTEPALRYGVHTLPALALPVSGPVDAVAEIAAASLEQLRAGKLLVGIGGEHTVSAGIARALHEQVAAFTLVQIDAHSDLRDSYEGSPYSHASVARRIFDLGAQIVQLGIRSVCREEIDFIRAEPERVRVFFAEEVHAGLHLEELARRVRDQNVFLTIDVDGLDPAVIAATGTPEPGGLSWMQTLEILRVVSREARIVALDCVELAPNAASAASEFAAAKLLYKALSYALIKADEK